MPHTMKIKVYYEDTDAGGVVYYANYLRFLERARTEFLADHDINVVALHNDGVLFAVAHVDIAYKKPAKLGDILEVITEVSELKHASLTIQNRIMRGETVIAEATLTVVCIDLQGKPRRLPDEFQRLVK